MNLGALSEADLAARLGGSGLAWDVGPFRVRLRTGLRDVARGVALLYADHPLCEDDGGIVDVDVKVSRVGALRRRASIWVDGEPVYVGFAAGLAPPMLEWTLNVTVFQRPHRYLMLHAAVVERDGRALLLCGRAGSGKSTLCAALMHRGWRLLSDEVAVLRPEDGAVVPVPRPVSLKGASIDVVRRFASEARLGPSWNGTIKGTVAHALPPRESVERAAETATPAWIVFPRYAGDGDGALVPVPKARALMAAADNAFNYSVLGTRGFLTLADTVERCDGFDLRFSDLAGAVTRLRDLAENAPPDRAVAGDDQRLR